MQHTICHVRVTPIAFRDPPLLNAAGIHEPWALRSIIEIETNTAYVGINETYGDQAMLDVLAKAAPATPAAPRFKKPRRFTPRPERKGAGAQHAQVGDSWEDRVS